MSRIYRNLVGDSQWSNKGVFSTMSNYNSGNMGANPNQMQQMNSGNEMGSPNQGANSNFNASSMGMQGSGYSGFQGSRRVNVGTGGMGMGATGGSGGMGAHVDRRRSSMGSFPLDPTMSDIFGRRASVGFDGMGPEAFFGRRDSLDSTTAVLDACILDLTRRRISMAMGVPPPMNSQSDYGIAPSGSSNNQVLTLQARQQQLQQQQMELDRKQREIDMQRQQLMAMQEAPMPAVGGGTTGNYNSDGQQSVGPSRMPPHGGLGRGNDGQQKWWICQVCNAKAFASREEAMQHEADCANGPSGPRALPPPQLPHQTLKMDRHSIGHGNPFAGLAPMDYQEHQEPLPGGDPEETEEDESLYTTLTQPLPLAMPSDKDWLTPLHCFVRRYCVEIFCASKEDVSAPSKGKRKPVQAGQVGIRCPHCHALAAATGSKVERGSVYYPTTISSIYNATMNLLQRHLHTCKAVPEDIMERYQTLKSDDARSGTSKKYWVESALSLGLVDSVTGIRVSTATPPPLPRISRQQQSLEMYNRRNSNDFFAHHEHDDDEKEMDDDGPLPVDGRFDDHLAKDDEDEEDDDEDEDDQDEEPTEETSKRAPAGGEVPEPTPLVLPEDKPYATTFSYELIELMQPCVFTEADRLGKRKGLPAGFAGLACRYCFGGYGSGRFFPSSIKTLSDTSKTLNVLYNHMMRCRKCPQEMKDHLEKLREKHDDERSKMKFGSQKAFFAKVWSRLHANDGHNEFERTERRASNHGLPPAMAGMKRNFNPLFSLQPFPVAQTDHFMMRTGAPVRHDSMAGMYGGLDVLSTQAEANTSKRQRFDAHQQ